MSTKVYSLSEVIGHKNLVNYLQQRVRDMNIPHKLLFHGQPGIGKSSIMRILACTIVSWGDANIDYDKLVKQVITDNGEHECVKVFDMAIIGNKEDEIKRVKEELQPSTFFKGNKVILLDEGHRMSEKAQDSLLVDLESLEDNIWVFLGTTEIGMLGSAMQSRFKRIPMTTFTVKDIERLAKREISKRGLKFSMPTDIAISLISYYSKNQARDCIDLLDSFPNNSTITSADLSVFINTNSSKEMIQLIRYLYGSMTLGLDYISTLTFDETSMSMLTELLKVGMGGESKALTPEDLIDIKEILIDEDINNLLGFTTTVLSSTKYTSRSISAAFIRNHKYMQKKPVVDNNGIITMASDMETMRKEAPNTVFENGTEELREEKLPQLETFFSNLPDVQS